MNRSQAVASDLSRRNVLQLGAAGAVGILFAGPKTPSFAQEKAPQKPLHDGMRLDVLSADPLNAQPDLAELIKSYITPNELFYVRSHAPAPKLDAMRFELSVEGMVDKPFKTGLKELGDRFKSHTVTATMTCAGNRRNEHSETKQIDGVPWGSGAIGNARWGGFRLADLLEKAGVREGAKHVWFEGVDKIPRSGGVIPFGASIPLDKAISKASSSLPVLVCDRMNGKPLPLDHGFPLRTVVPGYIVSCSVKWLGKIIVSDKPSDNHYVSHAYKIVSEGTEAEWSSAEPLMDFALNSYICRPAAGAKVKPGKLNVRGYALPSGGGSKIEAVQVMTSDGARAKAEITSPNEPDCWVLWNADIAITAKTKNVQVLALDSSGRVQPGKIDWNLKGYMYNAVQKLPLDVQG